MKTVTFLGYPAQFNAKLDGLPGRLGSASFPSDHSRLPTQITPTP